MRPLPLLRVICWLALNLRGFYAIGSSEECRQEESRCFGEGGGATATTSLLQVDRIKSSVANAHSSAESPGMATMQMVNEDALNTLESPDDNKQESGSWFDPDDLELLSDPDAGDGHTKSSVDLVITWHCEDISWIQNISTDYSNVLRVFLMHKIGDTDAETNQDCAASVAEDAIPEVTFKVFEIRLPNKGRDIHTPLFFLDKRYNTLADYTVFMQADEHWSLTFVPPVKDKMSVRSFTGNADAANDVIHRALEHHRRLIPVMPYRVADETPVLFADRESNEHIDEQDSLIREKLRTDLTFMFQNGFSDLYNRARDMDAMLFGGSPCNAPKSSPLTGIAFIPGYQFAVSRDAVLQHPRPAWTALTDVSLKCEGITYALERMPLQLFDSGRPLRNPESWLESGLCSLDPAVFRKPWDVFKAGDFWRARWTF
jgi:hypothetical protein